MEVENMWENIKDTFFFKFCFFELNVQNKIIVIYDGVYNR